MTIKEQIEACEQRIEALEDRMASKEARWRKDQVAEHEPEEEWWRRMGPADTNTLATEYATLARLTGMIINNATELLRVGVITSQDFERIIREGGI